MKSCKELIKATFAVWSVSLLWNSCFVNQGCLVHVDVCLNLPGQKLEKKNRIRLGQEGEKQSLKQLCFGQRGSLASYLYRSHKTKTKGPKDGLRKTQHDNRCLTDLGLRQGAW